MSMNVDLETIRQQISRELGIPVTADEAQLYLARAGFVRVQGQWLRRPSGGRFAAEPAHDAPPDPRRQPAASSN